MNYGFAYRLATYAALQEFAAQVFGAKLRLVVDSPHNSVYEETVDGRPAYVHRHNAARAWTPELMRGHPAFAATGQPLLVPGTNRTSSFLCVPAPRTAASTPPATAPAASSAPSPATAAPARTPMVGTHCASATATPHPGRSPSSTTGAWTRPCGSWWATAWSGRSPGCAPSRC
ncbi:RtcB family protein [Streptacidiphilus monticola]